MKAKVLISFYRNEGGHTAHRIYFEPHFKQAEADLNMIQNNNGGAKEWELQDVEVYGGLSPSWNPVESGLPEINKRILFKTENFEYVGFLSSNKKEFMGLFFDILGRNIVIENVTHWRYY